MKDKKGFTLTELLAVIVLIGVILAIAVPSYQSYVTRTRKEVLNNYRKRGIYDIVVIDVLKEDVEGKIVFGNLPMHLALH